MRYLALSVTNQKEINTLTKHYQVFNLKRVVCDQLKTHEEASPASKEEEASPAKKKKPCQPASQPRRRSLTSEEEALPARKKKPRQTVKSHKWRI